MKNDLTDDALLKQIEAAEGASYGINDASLSEDRAEAFRYYNGDPFGNEIEGRSQVVSRDVLDVVESALPQLLKIFVSGDEIVKFEPRGPEDEEAAEQETDAVNYYVTEKNDGFALFYTWFKDALLSKNGYVKAWYETKDETTNETYRGLTDEQMAMLVADEKVEIVAHTAVPDPFETQQIAQALQTAEAQGQPIPPPTTWPMLHDVQVSVTQERDCIRIANVAPEDILIGIDTRSVSLQDASFVQHRAQMGRSDIEAQGWEIPEGTAPYESTYYDEESNARDRYDETRETDAFDTYLVRDTYIRVNGELLRCVVIGNQIVFRESAEIIPFACITPHIMPHRHIGMSYADLTKDIQEIKSTLLRGQLDAMYLANQPRFAISDKVTLSDMLVSRPGGVVRVEGGMPGNEILPLQANAFPPTSFTLVEYLDSAKEKRTGVTAYNQGLDANSLNKTATGVNQIMQAAQQRLELVARTFANTGVRELFMLVHRLIRASYTRPEIMRLRNKWVTVDPREWKERKDMTIAVGLGTGNKDQQLMHLGTIHQQQMQLMQAGMPFITPQNIYETMRQIVINAGFKNPDQFVTNPETLPPPAPPQDPPVIQVKKMELAADAQKFQAQTQVKEQEDQRQAALEMQKFQAQAGIDQRQAEQEMIREAQRSQNDLQIEREKIAMQAELKRYEIQVKAQTDLEIARMNHVMQAQQNAYNAAMTGGNNA